MISGLLRRITGRYYHFKILVKYTPDFNNGDKNITSLRTVWMESRDLILNERDIKKSIAPEFMKQIPSKYLKNGTLDLTEFYYLGWFRPSAK